MNHEMGLFPENFENVKRGKKQREYRMYDDKRRKIKIGDTITFINTQTQETVVVVVDVINMHLYKDFKTCYTDFWEQDFSNRGQPLEQIIENTYNNWWSKELEEKYGCVVIDIKLANPIK